MWLYWRRQGGNDTCGRCEMRDTKEGNFELSLVTKVYNIRPVVISKIECSDSSAEKWMKDELGEEDGGERERFTSAGLA